MDQQIHQLELRIEELRREYKVAVDSLRILFESQINTLSSRLNKLELEKTDEHKTG